MAESTETVSIVTVFSVNSRAVQIILRDYVIIIFLPSAP